jgi:hypothetical protein
MREGDTLSFQVVIPKSNPALRTTAQFEARCSTAQLHLLYLDGAQRMYPLGPGQYSAARALSATLYSNLTANPSFQQACAQTPQPDWRLVKTGEREQWVLLDRNSLTTVNGQIRFWAAFDDATVLNDLPYNAPYAQKREHLAVSCASGTYQLLAGYDLDAHNRVSDGQVDPAPTPRPIAGSNADYQALFAQVCANPQQTGALAPFKPRVKSPVAITLQSVQAPVLAAIAQLNLAPPVRTLKYLRTEGTSTYRDKSHPAGEERFMASDTASGQLSVALRGDSYESQEVSWRGLITLVSKANFGGGRGMADSNAVSRLSFTGDWKNLPVGATLGFTYQRASLNSVVGAYGDTPVTTHCTVEREYPARELNSTLAGSAKALSCSNEGDKYQRVNHYEYLVDYGYFFSRAIDKNVFYYSEYRMAEVKE